MSYLFFDKPEFEVSTSARIVSPKLEIAKNPTKEIVLGPGFARSSDRKPLEFETTGEDLFGKLFGDKGYLSRALAEALRERGLELVTSLRKDMKARFRLFANRILTSQTFHR